MEREKLLSIKEARGILNEAFEKLKEIFPDTYIRKDVEENFGEEEDIVGFYIEIPLFSHERLPVKFSLSGWLELDRRIEEEEDNTPNVWCSFAIAFSGLGKEKEVEYFGAGYKDDYRIIRADYNHSKKEWENFYIDTL